MNQIRGTVEDLDISRDDAISMVHAVVRLFEETAELVRANASMPLRDSRANLELRSFSRPECLLGAYAQGSLLIEVTADQLMAFARSLEEPVLTMAPWACVRSLLEPGARACGLLDPTIDAQERVRRSLALRYKGFQQQLIWGRTRYGQEFVEWIEARLGEVATIATDLGFGQLVDGKGKCDGAGERWVNATDVIKKFLGEADSYQLLSAITHGHDWAIDLGCLREVGAEDKREETIENRLGGIRYRKCIKPVNVWFLCGLAGKTLLMALTCKSTLFGWKREPLDAVDRAISTCSYEVQGMLKAKWTEWAS